MSGEDEPVDARTTERAPSNRRALWAISELVRALRSERAALQEVRGTLSAEERSLHDRLVAVQREADELSEALVGQSDRIAELEEELQGARQAMAALDGQRRMLRRRVERARRGLAQTEGTFGERRDEFARAEALRRSVMGRVLRMKYRLEAVGEESGEDDDDLLGPLDGAF